MASGRLPLPPFLLVKPAFGFATFVTVPLLSASKCLRMGGRDSAMRIFFIPRRILALYFKMPFFPPDLTSSIKCLDIFFKEKSSVHICICL